MSINTLYNEACRGEQGAEQRLFQGLTVRFRLFVYQRVWNEDDAQEIVQEALATVAQEYRKTEFQISFSAWAYKVLQNKISNYVRKKSFRDTVVQPVPGSEDDYAAWNPDPSLERKLLDCLREMSRANARYARILNFRYQGYDVEDICERLRMKPNNFYVVLLRARAVLKQCLEKGGFK